MTEQRPTSVSPGSTLDWSWDWTAWLAGGDSIVGQSVAADTGLTVVGPPSRAGAVITVKLAVDPSLTIGSRVAAACTVTTALGLIDARSIHLQVARR